MNLTHSASRFLDNLKNYGCSPNTIRAYKSDLSMFLHSMYLGYDYTPSELENFMASYLSTHKCNWSINTLNRKLACFRKYGQYIGKADFLSSYKRPTSPPGLAHPIQEGVDGILKMIETARKPHHKALVTLTGLLGLRVAEALSVTCGDFHQDFTELEVIGKGEKTRIIPVSDHVWGCLVYRYFEILSCETHGSNHHRFVPLSNRAARLAITNIAKRAELKNPVSSHDLRMTFGTVAYYTSGGDLRAVQELLGHSNSHTTENYTQVSMDKMRSAAEITRR